MSTCISIAQARAKVLGSVLLLNIIIFLLLNIIIFNIIIFLPST